jgi:signal transduction histidine kinase
MKNLNIIFFPDENYLLIACLCYALIFLTAYKRFNSLITNYGTYDAPDRARPWTTWVRYHAAAAIYACLYAALFAILYQLFHRHPQLIEAAAGLLGQESAAAELIEKLDSEMNLISPLMALVFLSWGAEKYRRTAAVDRRLRYFFQQLGSIPGAVSQTIRKLKKYELEFVDDDCSVNLPDELKDEIMLPMLQKDPKSLEHLYTRACHLFHQIDHWNSISSDFFQFQTAYHQAFENIKARYEKLNRNTKRYYQLKLIKLKFATDAQLWSQVPEVDAESQFINMYPKVLTELRKDLKNELKGILENIYIFIACGIHSKGVTAHKRKKLLQSFGFKIDSGQKINGDGLDPNDMTILGLCLIFVIPLSAVFARFIGNDNPVAIQSIRYVVWSAMAMFVGLASVAFPIVIRQLQNSSQSAFWRFIQPQEGQHSWCAYLISGVLAGAAGILSIFLLNFLDPESASMTPLASFIQVVPWGLVPLAIAFSLGYHLDRTTASTHIVVAKEAAATALMALLAALLALSIKSGLMKVEELIPRMYFSLTAAALLGSIIGAVVPYRYRRHQDRQMKVTFKPVNLNEIIQGAIKKFSERASKEQIVVTADLAGNLPMLNADAFKITMAIDGLLSNALEFTPKEGQIKISADLKDDGAIRFCVQDSGIGMSNSRIKSIVNAQPEEIHSAWKRTGDGSDADLVQVRAIAEKHSGKLELESKRWVGTKVTVELPKKIVIAETTGPDFQHSLQNEETLATA